MGQLRKHLKRNIFHRIRYLYFKMKLEKCGNAIFFEKNVQFMRFPENISLGDELVVKEGSRICSCNKNAKISIGKKTTVGYHSFIFASEKISIGENCLIAPFTYIVDSNHEIKKGLNINSQNNTTDSIKIGNDVWLGTGSKILAGVTIEDGAVIAAGAIVKNDVKANQIVGGIPAKVIGERK
ncbi:MAG: galactoside O-acetyltransferase [Crocinitomicaceae bacterium]|nr:galactoside O-acetyltransferase [Crocinitomicaceae bacterium]